MDSDIKAIKVIKTIARKSKFNLDYFNYKILPAELGNAEIESVIKRQLPYMVSRGGAVELRCIGEYLKKHNFSDSIRNEIQVCAGVFPTNDEFLEKFCEYYMQCMGNVDLLALWGVGAEKKVVEKYCIRSNFTVIEALEPYYYRHPWSEALDGKKVLIIHPFETSIRQQYERREKLFENKNVLPKFASLDVIKAVQSNAGEKASFDDWFDALEFMQNEIQKKDFDVAIIGAGAYSLPLASYVKSIGKVAIQMSGATQILFGIKGRRWEKIPEVARFFNEYWIRPSESETPKDNRKVEGGSYW